jgi:hypothetical protein
MEHADRMESTIHANANANANAIEVAVAAADKDSDEDSVKALEVHLSCSDLWPYKRAASPKQRTIMVVSRLYDSLLSVFC